MSEPVITDTFYLKKFMQIQQANVVLWRKLHNIKENDDLRAIIETYLGDDFFNNLDDLVG
jgi:hypothetical protein